MADDRKLRSVPSSLDMYCGYKGIVRVKTSPKAAGIKIKTMGGFMPPISAKALADATNEEGWMEFEVECVCTAGTTGSRTITFDADTGDYEPATCQVSCEAMPKATTTSMRRRPGRGKSGRLA